MRKLLKGLNDNLPLKHGSIRPRTLRKRVADDPQKLTFHAEIENKIGMLANFQRSFPLNNALFGFNLRQNAFQMIPHMSSSDTGSIVGADLFGLSGGLTASG